MTISVVLMASGFAARYGRNKLLEEFRGSPLFVHAIRQALASGADSISLVTRYSEIRHYVETMKEEEAKRETGRPRDGRETSWQAVNVIWNGHPERGISESLRLGLTAQREADGCCFMVCDQPLLSAGTLCRMFDAFRASPEAIYVCSDGRRRGNPVLFPQDLFAELLSLRGDTGGRQILGRYPARVREVPVAGPEELYDIDSVRDLESLRQDAKEML